MSNKLVNNLINLPKKRFDDLEIKIDFVVTGGKEDS